MPDPVPSVEPGPLAPEVTPSAPRRRPPNPRPGPAPRVVLIIAVVVAVVLAGVFLAIGGGSSGGSSLSGAAPTFSSARAVADQFAAEHGHWTLIEAVGVALANASYFPYDGPTGNATCIPITLVGTIPSNLTLPAFRGSLTSGEAPIWLFAYVAPGVGGELAEFEVGGRLVLAIEFPASCASGPPPIPGITTPIINSSTAVSAAAAAGGTEFLRAHPTGVSLTMEIWGGLTTPEGEIAAGPQWELSWSTCSNTLFGTGSPTSGYAFSATVNATTGSIVPSSVANGTCGPSGTPPAEGISDAVTFGFARLSVGSGTGGTVASQGCTSGDYCYAVPVASASENLTPADFELNVENFSDGAIVESTVGFAIVNASGVVLIYSMGATETEWTPAAGNAQTLLAAGMAVYVDTGPAYPALEDLGLVLTGEGPFANSSLGLTL